VNETGSGLWQMAGFAINAVQPSFFASRVLINPYIPIVICILIYDKRRMLKCNVMSDGLIIIVIIIIIIIMALQPCLGLDHFFSFFILYTAGRIPWTGDQPVARPLPAHRTTQTQNKRP
jgi:hypothetical protein